MKAANKLNSLIIGVGNIGAFFDTPESSDILTHAHAFYKHKQFNLIGFVDNNYDKAKNASELWNCKNFKSIEEAFSSSDIDVVSVAVPDEYHYEVLKQVAQYQLKLVFAEKPLAKTLKEAEELIKIYQSKNLPVLVNYSRRFVPEFFELKQNIENGQYGSYITGTGYYGKGILHNGSHMIDLLRYLIGEVECFEYINSINDFYDNDASVSATLKLADNKYFQLNAVDCRNFTIFEADFIFEKVRLRMLNSGFIIEEYNVEDSKVFKGYKNLNLANTINTSLGFSLYNAVGNIHEFLTESKPLNCSIYDGFKAMKVSLEILEAASK